MQKHNEVIPSLGNSDLHLTLTCNPSVGRWDNELLELMVLVRGPGPTGTHKRKGAIHRTKGGIHLWHGQWNNINQDEIKGVFMDLWETTDKSRVWNERSVWVVYWHQPTGIRAGRGMGGCVSLFYGGTSFIQKVFLNCLVKWHSGDQ